MKIYSKQFIALCLLLVLFSGTGHSKTVYQEQSEGFITTAEYLAGEKSKPAVLILHGMLQTRNYLTVQSLIAAINDAGYTILAPNLSLSISNRKKSLPCEAIHNHNMAQDIEEIDRWVKWLEKHGHDAINLVGHSYGSLQLLVYANTKRPPSVSKLIAASLIDIEKTNDQTPIKEFLAKAQQQVKNNNTQLHEYSISYCKKYVSPAADYISYAKWTKDKLIAEINKLDIPITVIIGGNDLRVEKNWIYRLKKANLNLITIEGANHFFDAAYEFDLNDNVLKELLSK